MPVFTGMTYHKLNFIHEIHSSFSVCVLVLKIRACDDGFKSDVFHGNKGLQPLVNNYEEFPF